MGRAVRTHGTRCSLRCACGVLCILARSSSSPLCRGELLNHWAWQIVSDKYDPAPTRAEAGPNKTAGSALNAWGAYGLFCDTHAPKRTPKATLPSSLLMLITAGPTTQLLLPTLGRFSTFLPHGCMRACMSMESWYLSGPVIGFKYSTPVQNSKPSAKSPFGPALS